MSKQKKQKREARLREKARDYHARGRAAFDDYRKSPRDGSCPPDSAKAMVKALALYVPALQAAWRLSYNLQASAEDITLTQKISADATKAANWLKNYTAQTADRSLLK